MDKLHPLRGCVLLWGAFIETMNVRLTVVFEHRYLTRCVLQTIMQFNVIYLTIVFIQILFNGLNNCHFLQGGGVERPIRKKMDQFDVNDTMNRLNAMRLQEEYTNSKGTGNDVTTSADSLGRSLSQEEVISNKANGLNLPNHYSLLRSSSDCTGSSRRQVHPQPLLSRYAFERRSIRRSKVIHI